jgi:uncharacterized SAM-dependent methyltransferase
VTELSGYSTFAKCEWDLLLKFETAMFLEDPNFGDRMVWDLGGGDGTKAIQLLRQKIKTGKCVEPIEYRDLDCSRELIETAKNNVSCLEPSVSFQSHHINLETDSVKEYFISQKEIFNKKDVFYFLGLTLGNFAHPERVLTNLRNGMSEDAILVVGFDLHKEAKVEKLVQIYSDPSFDDLDFYLLRELELQKDVDGKMETTYKISPDNSHGEILREFVFERDIEFHINSVQGAISVLKFMKGERIKINHSHRFGLNEVQDIFNSAGFSTEISIDDFGYALVIAKPSPIQ